MNMTSTTILIALEILSENLISKCHNLNFGHYAFCILWGIINVKYGLVQRFCPNN